MVAPPLRYDMGEYHTGATATVNEVFHNKYWHATLLTVILGFMHEHVVDSDNGYFFRTKLGAVVRLALEFAPNAMWTP